MKQWIKFLLLSVVVFCMPLSDLHAQTNQTITIQPAANSNALHYGEKTDLQFVVYFNVSICGPISMELTVPSRLVTSAIRGIGDAGSITPQVVNTVYNANETKTLSIDLIGQPPITETQWINTSFYLADFYMPGSGCAPEQLNVYAKLISSNTTAACSSAENNKVLQIVENDPFLGYIYSSADVTHRNANEDPLFIDFVVYKNNSTPTRYDQLDFNFDIGNTQMVPIKVMTLAYNDFQAGGASNGIGYFTTESLPFQYINNNNVLFSSQTLTGLTYRALYYRVYFDLSCSSGSIDFHPQVTASGISLCNPLAPVIPLVFEATENIVCFDDTPRLSKPSSNNFYAPNSSCINCTEALVDMEIDNTYNTVGYTDLDYIMDVPSHIYITRIENVGGGLANVIPDEISYQACGSTQWTVLDNYNLPADIHIDHLKYHYNSLLPGKSSDIYFYYRGKDVDCNGTPVASSGNSIITTRFEGPIATPSKGIPVYVNTSCVTGSVVEYVAPVSQVFNFTAYDEVKVLDHDEHYLDLALFYNNGNLINYAFDFSLTNNLVFSNEDIKFLVTNQGINGLTESMYMDLADAKILYAAQLGSASYSFEGRTLKLKNLNINSPCMSGSGSIYIHFLVKVKSIDHPLAGIFRNEIDLKGNPAIGAGYNNYKFFDNFTAKTELFVDCESISQLQNSNLRVGQPFSYNYVFNNTGNQTFKDIVMVATLPYVGDKIIFSSENRNSEYAITRDCSASIRIVQLDIDGNIIKDNNTIAFDVDYKLTDELCADDFDIPGGSACGTWITNCGGTVKTIRIKTRDGYELPAYSKLVLNIAYKIPAGVALGKTANHEFIATATRTSAITTDSKTDYIKSNIVSITTAARSSCEPPKCKECVSSFAPERGKKYLLSGWVKESYTGLTPVNYINSGIRLAFNEATVLLPVMKASGPMVDGWQRIESAFIVPEDADNIEVQLMNLNASGDVFFDDIRIHPFESNMKSFVYNPSTQKLVAELDENNYATLYEYDDEGILIRVKKETERGVMTIKETRMNQSKITTGQ